MPVPTVALDSCSWLTRVDPDLVCNAFLLNIILKSGYYQLL